MLFKRCSILQIKTFFNFIMLFVYVISFHVNAEPEILYRGDSRPPDEIIQAGGFYPKKAAGLENVKSLFEFVNNNTAQNDANYSYVSTTSDLKMAISFFGNNGDYVYMIHASNNLYEVNKLLGKYNLYPEENEYVALGGIEIRQIVGWHRIINSSSQELDIFVENPFYKEKIYKNKKVTEIKGSVYAMAGFPDGHPAWIEEPWVKYVSSACNMKSKSGKLCSSFWGVIMKKELSKHCNS